MPAQGSFPAENRGKLGFHLPAMARSGDGRGRCWHRKRRRLPGGDKVHLPPPQGGPGLGQTGKGSVSAGTGRARPPPSAPAAIPSGGGGCCSAVKPKAPSHPRPGGRCVTCPPCADSQPGFPNHEFTGGRRLMTSRGLQDLKNVASAQIQNQGGEMSSATGNRSFGGLSGTPFTCQPPAWAAELPPA